MAKKMLIDATHPEETRVVVVDGTQVEEFDFETVNKRQLAGNIYLAKVTRVEPSLQAAFIEYGGNRHGFLAFAEIHPDYYQIPAADRRALLEEERAAAAAAEAEEDARDRRVAGRSRRPQAAAAAPIDAAIASEAIPGMELTDAEPQDDAAPVALGAPAGSPAATEEEDDDRPRDVERQVETASERDDSIESVADEDVASEMPKARSQSRARRYKIQEVIKVRQIMLVQVVKEERGNKGAALTTYLSLAGRYCVLMPNTARGGGISRKITNAADRSKLKEIASELEVPQGAGLIIRTAGSQRTRTEIRRDYEYLMRLWEQIRELTFRSVAPAPIYEEGDLIKRSIRDLYSKDIDEVLVEGERGYRTAKDFMKMIMPSHAKNVKHYADPVPLLARYQAESFLGSMFNPVVQLKSGGYIVIGITEALVAIDVNSGRATKEGSIEDTAYKTNCEAADEIARQLRLRDLAGLIVIDFIDMDERKNNAAVEKRFKERLKTDRARIQVGRISGFGLLEMSRQRLRPGMLESTTQPCAHCHGTGLIRSDDSLALQVLRAIEEEGTRKRSAEVLVKAPVAVANYLINAKREHIGLIETRSGMSVRVEADPALVSPDYVIEKFKTATRVVPEPVSAALSVDARLMAAIDDEADAADEDEVEVDAVEAVPAEARAPRAGDDESGEGRNGTRRRRRRRRRGGSGRPGEEGAGFEGEGDAETGVTTSGDEDVAGTADAEARPEAVALAGPDAGPDDAAPMEGAAPPRSRSRSRSRSRRASDTPAEAAVAASPLPDEDRAEDGEAVPLPAVGGEDVLPEAFPAPAAELPEERAPSEAADLPEDRVPEAAAPEPAAAAALEVAAPEPVSETVAPDAAPERPAEAAGEQPEEAEPDPANATSAPAETARPKRRGWWSFGG